MSTTEKTPRADEILHRDDLLQGGFAGLREHRLVMDPKVFGAHAERGTWPGVGNFVYLADARFVPKGETGMHPHHEVDVITFMLKGRMAHQGSLEDGQMLEGFDVQVQRAGGHGFHHNEVNPDEYENRILQLWVLPEKSGQPPGYQIFKPQLGAVTSIYGGSEEPEETYPSKTHIKLALLTAGQELAREGPFLAYLATGSGRVNGTEVTEGDLIRGERLEFRGSEETHLTVVYLE